MKDPFYGSFNRNKYLPQNNFNAPPSSPPSMSQPPFQTYNNSNSSYSNGPSSPVGSNHSSSTNYGFQFPLSSNSFSISIPSQDEMLQMPQVAQVTTMSPLPLTQAQRDQIAAEAAAIIESHNNPQNRQIVLSDSSQRQQYVDITDLLNMPQTDAAKRLGVPTSTLSKRWKEAAVKRKWPYRTVCKLEKEITTLLHNISNGPVSAEMEQTLAHLLRRRQEELRTVIIRI